MVVVEPVRVRRTYVQSIKARPEEVFPLLCPVRESEWVEGWDPLVVYSLSGLAEEDCVFVTEDSERESIWMITRRDPEQFHLEMIKVTPALTAAKINITLSEDGEGLTKALVTYMYTALSEEGVRFVEAYTEEYFSEFMAYWERTINAFLMSRVGA